MDVHIKESKMKKTIYLCGGINGLSDKDCTDWREYCKDRLKDSHLFLDPMRRDYRGKEDDSATKIVLGDLADINKSDILLVNALKPSWGTAMEVHYAFNAHKEIITIVEGKISPWLRYHSHSIFSSFDEALDYIK